MVGGKFAAVGQALSLTLDLSPTLSLLPHAKAPMGMKRIDFESLPDQKVEMDRDAALLPGVCCVLVERLVMRGDLDIDCSRFDSPPAGVGGRLLSNRRTDRLSALHHALHLCLQVTRATSL